MSPKKKEEVHNQAESNVSIIRFKRLHLLYLEIDLYLHHLKTVSKVKPPTYELAKGVLRLFARSLADNNIDFSPRMIGTQTLTELLEIHQVRGLSGFSINTYFKIINRFFESLFRKGAIARNPFDGFEIPPAPRLVPKPIPESEVLKILEAPDISTFFGFRMRVILELLYGSGLRIRECLKLKKLDFTYLAEDDVYLRVIGKGDKYREIPTTPESLWWVRQYEYLTGNSRMDAYLFPGATDKAPITYSSIQARYQRMLAEVGLPKTYTLHRLRHSFGSHLLDHGADIKSVQELMGHADLRTTQGYAQVSTARLREVYRQSHPRMRGAVRPRPYIHE